MSQPSVSETVAPFYHMSDEVLPQTGAEREKEGFVCVGDVGHAHCPHLQPLVDGLSSSELSRLKALELLGGDGLWESEL